MVITITKKSSSVVLVVWGFFLFLLDSPPANDFFMPNCKDSDFCHFTEGAGMGKSDS